MYSEAKRFKSPNKCLLGCLPVVYPSSTVYHDAEMKKEKKICKTITGLKRYLLLECPSY